MPDVSTQRPFDLLAYGDPNVDLVFETDTTPRADQKVLGRRLGTFAGGTVANVACAASRLGVHTASYGRVGYDAEGRMLMAAFDEFGVSNEFVRTVSGPCSTAMIVVESSGEKALIYAPLPTPDFDEVHLGEALRQSRLIYSMPYDIDEFKRLSKLAHKTGTEVAIDIETPAIPDRARVPALLENSDIVFMNESGFRAISDAALGLESMHDLLQRGPNTVVVTLGAAGALACDRNTRIRQPAFTSKLVDATGAGDCFSGAFLAAALRAAIWLHALPMPARPPALLFQQSAHEAHCRRVGKWRH